MKKIISIIFFVSIFSSVVFTQKTVIKKSKFYLLSGNIGNSQVIMYINFDELANGKVSGKYYYNNIKQFISLNGTVKNNTIEINEGEDNNYTGTFYGLILNDGTFKGEWSSIDNKKKYDFELKVPESYPISYISIIQSSINVENDIGTTFGCLKDAIFIDNPKQLSTIDKITSDFDGVRRVIEDRIIENINSGVTAEYEEWIKNKDDKVNYDIISDVSVSYLDDKIISLSTFEYSYMGGAHGIYGVFPKIYSIDTGRHIGRSASDIVRNVKDRTLIEIMRKKLLENLKEDDYFDFNSIKLSDTFDILPTGVKFIWQIYDIAPYVVGMVEINFTFNELKPFLDPKSPFAYLFN